MLIGGSLYRSEISSGGLRRWMASSFESIQVNSSRSSCEKEKFTKFVSIPTEPPFFSSKHFSSYLSLPGEGPR